MATNGIDVIANVQLYNLDAALATQDPVVPTKTVLAISGTTKDDIVTVNAKADMEVTINTGEGNDTVRAASSQAAISVNTGTGKDWVDGSKFDDTIILGEGNDTTYAGAGNDTIDGGSGSDYLSAGEGNDIVIGGTGRDYLEGSRGDDELWGGDKSGDDDNERDNFIYRLDRTLKNNKVNLGLEWGNDTIHDFHAHTRGMTGDALGTKGDLIEMDDFFMRLSDVDVNLILGAVNDIVTTNAKGQLVATDGKLYGTGAKKTFTQGDYIGLTDETNDDGDTSQGPIGHVDNMKTETIYNVNGLEGGHYEVTVTATSHKDNGQTHVDIELGFRNLDLASDKGATITIENADDLNAVASFTREGAKLVHGKDDAGKGDVIDLSSQDYKTALGDKGAYFYGFAGNDKVTGTDVDDNLGGGDGVDTINGGKGNDRVYGDAGNDELHGGAGNDYLSGGADNDRLYGEDGKDTLWGGTGTNFLTGGGDKDIFYINGSGLTFDKNDGHAIATLEKTKTIISDFALDVDKIKLGDIFADYRISNTTEQKAKYVDWLMNHVEVKDVAGKMTDGLMTYEADGTKDVVIHLNTMSDNDNVLVIAGNDSVDADFVGKLLVNGNTQAIDSMFVFG